MRHQTLIHTVLLVVGVMAAAPTSRAQIASYTDAHGKLVYTNADSPKGKSGSTMSSSPVASPGSSPSGDVLQTTAAPTGAFDKIVKDAAQRHSLDPELVKAVISTESGWNPRAISRKGAMGLMQLEPGTAQRFGVWNPFDPEQNVEGGSAYLKALLDRYNGDLTRTLAAYNAGEHAVDASGGVPAYPETQQYVQKVTDKYFFAPGGNGASARYSAPKAPPVRKEVENDGKVVFTNQ